MKAKRKIGNSEKCGFTEAKRKKKNVSRRKEWAAVLNTEKLTGR